MNGSEVVWSGLDWLRSELLLVIIGRAVAERRVQTSWIVQPLDVAEHGHVGLDLLSMRRAGVSIAAGTLQEAELISYALGRILILDRPGLEAAPCACCRTVRERPQRAGLARPRVTNRVDGVLATVQTEPLLLL